MRAFLAMTALPLLFTLAACGGAGPDTVASAGSSGSGSGSGGSGGGVSGGGSTPTPTPSTFLDVNTATNFSAIGGFQSLDVDSTTKATLYQGDANTVNAPGGTVNYDPRDGIFTLTLNDSNAGVNHTYRFQDPAHRSTPATPSNEIPNYTDFNYLQVLDDGTTTPATLGTFFYQRPGSQTNYVSLAGFVRSDTGATETNYQRGAFVFGQLTPTSQVPLSGTATYEGGFLATMINGAAPNYTSAMQWINGNSLLAIDFGHGTVAMDLTGALSGAYNYNTPAASTYQANTGFFAHGTATINLIAGGFSGQFTNACFVAACGTTNSVAIDFSRVSAGSATAGASSIDGAFYGPNGVNVGGSFRIVGGVPNNRVDILGGFTGAKK